MCIRQCSYIFRQISANVIHVSSMPLKLLNHTKPKVAINSKEINKVKAVLKLGFFIYILECSDKTLYCGYTNDLHARINTHNAGKGAKYTKGRLPIKLIYSEAFSTKGEALKREAAIKKLSRSDKFKLINIAELRH